MTSSDDPVEVRVEGTADPSWVEQVHAACDELWLRAPGTPEPDRLRFETAVIELATNVVRHTRPDGPDPVRTEVVLRSAGPRLEAELADTGTAVPVDLDPGPVDDLAESGRGIRLVLRAVDSLSLDRERGRNVWRVVRTRGG